MTATPAGVLEQLIRELLTADGHTVAEVAARRLSPTFQQRIDGETVDRDAFIAGIITFRGQLATFDITVLDELSRDRQYAERHVIATTDTAGARRVREVYVFATRDPDGRFERIDEATITVG